MNILTAFFIFSTLVVLDLSFSAEITMAPVSKNVTLHSAVNFTCEAIGTFLDFLINNQGTPFPSGFTQLSTQLINSNTGLRRRVLMAIAYGSNNNSEISCTTLQISPYSFESSNIALLKIQGSLASVGQLTATQLAGTSNVQLSWSPPYTLDNVPIIGYDINITNPTISYRTTTNSTVITLTDDTDPCTLTNVSVSPVNGAGVGRSNNISFYYQREIKPVVPVTINLIVQDSMMSLQVATNVNNLCLGEYPSFINIQTNDGTETLNLIPSSLPAELMGDRHISLNNTVTIPLSVNVTLYTTDGVQLDATTDVQYNTYSNFTVSNGTVCVICHLASNDTGCQLTIVNSTVTIYERTLNINRTQGCIKNISQSLFDIILYNIGRDGLLYSHGIQYQLLFKLPEIPTQQMSQLSAITVSDEHLYKSTIISTQFITTSQVLGQTSSTPFSISSFSLSPTPLETFTLSSVTNPLPVTSFFLGDNKGNHDLSNKHIIILISSAVFIIFVVVIMVVMCMGLLLALMKYKKKEKKETIKTTINQAYEQIQIKTASNEAYVFISS